VIKMSGFMAAAARCSCIGLALGSIGVALPTAAGAQPAEQDGVTVYGRRLPPGEPGELSRAVSYRDLDLRTDMGATTLRKRVKDTAAELCKELGDTETRSTSIIPTCEEVAVGAASWDVRRVITAARQESAAR
jgi:UrcA family protein